MNKHVHIIIPACNEECNVPVMVMALKQVFQSLPYDYSICFIDDGSIDNTLENIKAAAAVDNRIHYLSLTRNFGHQNALKAGLDLADADAVIMMDADLQHPPSLIPEMLQNWEAGFEVVYTIRKDHKEVPSMKRKTSNLFYHLINSLSSIDLEAGTADFRLMDRNVVKIFKEFNETDLFMRGLVKWVGFKQIGLEYEPGIRKSGQSKYSLKKMIRFALEGITSFSTKPLYIAVYLGFIFSFLSILYIPYIFISMYFDHAISGWASVIVTIAFFGGLQLMILGIIGVYLGKLFMQSKHRPLYIIKEKN